MILKLKKKNYPGKLIIFEGTDGAGKTTLINKTINLLKEKYNEEDILSLKQPTDLSRKTKLFQKMMYSANHEDIDYRAVQLLTMSDRIQHGFETIEPALKEGKIVVCDRYVYTSYVNMVARGYTKEKWFKNVSKHILKPDIKFLAYVKPSEAIKRIKARPEEKDKYLDEGLLTKVARLFKKVAQKDKFLIINTIGDEKDSFKIVKEVLKKEGII